LPPRLLAFAFVAITLAVGCWVKEGEGLIDSSCQLNSDCNPGDAGGLYCNDEKVCARDCDYAFPYDCPAGLTCTSLGQCCAPDAGPTCKVPVIIISEGDDTPDASVADAGEDAGTEADVDAGADGGTDAGDMDSGA
jgi:hypothetical protein